MPRRGAQYLRSDVSGGIDINRSPPIAYRTRYNAKINSCRSKIAHQELGHFHDSPWETRDRYRESIGRYLAIAGYKIEFIVLSSQWA